MEHHLATIQCKKNWQNRSLFFSEKYWKCEYPAILSPIPWPIIPVLEINVLDRDPDHNRKFCCNCPRQHGLVLRTTDRLRRGWSPVQHLPPGPPPMPPAEQPKSLRRQSSWAAKTLSLPNGHFHYPVAWLCSGTRKYFLVVQVCQWLLGMLNLPTFASLGVS